MENSPLKLTSRGKKVIAASAIAAGAVGMHAEGTTIPVVGDTVNAAYNAANVTHNALASAGNFVTDRISGGSNEAKSVVPDSKKGLDPTSYRADVVPNVGAFTLAQQIAPNANPWATIDQMKDQLGHDPQAGDTVDVAKSAPVPAGVEHHPINQ